MNILGEGLGIALLRLDQVHHRFRQRTVIADAAGENDIDAMRRALVHDAALEHAGLDRLRDATSAVDGVDRRHVIAVPLLDRRPGLQVDTERGAGERELDVVDGERIAGEHGINVAKADEFGEVLDPSGVHDDRSGHDGDAASGLLDVAHHRRDARDAPLDAPFR